MKMFKRITASVLTAAMIATLVTGCGEATDDGKNENITLEAPVGVTADYAIAAERDMYEYDVYSSSVNPLITEYSFAKDQRFKKYGATPGSTVNAGDVLVYSETKELDKQIRDLQEEIDDFASYHTLQVDGLQKDINDAKKAEWEAWDAYRPILEFEPDENSDFYPGWAAMAKWPESAYNRSKLNRERLEQNLKQINELYNLEYNFKKGNLSRINDKIADATVTSNVTGEVVACNFYYSGDYIEKDKAIMAVGDMSRKVLHTEYISKGNIGKAIDIYAIIDGKRYEIEYENMEPEEYRQLSNDGESVHTTFYLDDPANEVAIGSYAAVIVEKNRRSNVLCIPNDAIKKESDGYYTYLYNDGESNYVPVTIGMRDGLYAEVLDGIKPGDKVLSETVPKKTTKTAQLGRGDYSVEVSKDGFLYYPYSEWITNPVEYGTTYLKEMFVTNNEVVVAGQTLATIEVVADQIEIDRLNRQIGRLTERLAKKKTKKADNDAKNKIDRSLERDIAETELSINQLRRQLGKISKYSGIVEIKAPTGGVVMEANSYDSIKPGDLLPYDANIVEIANDSLSYIILRDDKNQLNYANEAEIRVSSTKGSNVVTGKVVTANQLGLSRGLSNEYALVAIPQEEMASIAGTTMVEGGRWDRNSFKVTAKVRSEKNVLTIPKTAVTLKDKSTYVTVIKDDGTVENVSFIPGGSDANLYWVVDGLTEGMTICWE